MFPDLTLSRSAPCPFTNQEQTIKVTYTETPVLGALTTGHKVKKFSCPHRSECTYVRDQEESCPVLDALARRD